MRIPKLLPAVLILFLLVPASITWAQTISSQKGLTTAVFQRKEGKIKINLPEDIRSGDIISGTVVLEPSGANDRLRQRSLEELLKYKLRVGDPTQEGAAAQPLSSLYLTGSPASPLGKITIEESCAIALTDPSNKTITSPLAVKPPDASRVNHKTGCTWPTHVLAGSPFRISGSFDGDLANTNCTIGALPATKLAESPRNCFIVFPEIASGLQSTRLSEAGQPACTGQVTGVEMQVTTGKLNLRKGERTFIGIQLTGLEGIKDTCILRLVNQSRGVVSLIPSDEINEILPPDSLQGETYRRQFSVQSIQTGSFSIDVDLDIPNAFPDQTGPATEPVKPLQTTCPGCDCSATGDARINVVKSGKKWFYTGSVEAVCKGLWGTGPECIVCGVKSVTYKWVLSANPLIAWFDGSDSNASVMVNISGRKGNFVLRLVATITCSDGTQCTRSTNVEETITGEPPPHQHDCTIDYEWCAASSIKVRAIASYPAGSLLKNMRPGDPIALSVYAEDNDVLIQHCTCSGGTELREHPSLPDELEYTWELAGNGTGTLVRTSGNSNIYQIPFCVEKYPVWEDVVVHIRNKGGKANDEEVILVFTIMLKIVVDGYNSQLSIGQGNAVPLRTVEASVTHYFNKKPGDIICPSAKACCTARVPGEWLKGQDLSVSGLSPVKEYVIDQFPDNIVLLSAQASDADDLVIQCFDPVAGTTVNQTIAKIPDVIDYTWTVASGNAKLLYNKGPVVALLHTYGDNNKVYVRCEMRDSHKQYTDPVPEFYPAEVPPRKKPVAAVALGDISYLLIPLRHDELEEVCGLAASKFRKAGYESECTYRTNIPVISSFIKSPRVQAFMMIGHGADGEMTTTNNKEIGYADIPLMQFSKWNCNPRAPLHPSIKELALLGCETHDERWLDYFFRLENYKAYREKVYSTSFHSNIVNYIKTFTPGVPRIAPPEK